ncbi:hypothetical protein [Paenibacillus sp. FSL H7-0756]|uniref:hypothetical protein n=1 Tax=Paenibacillus sp. FSL H7-0756 TaxID=2954738 RepID=UPI0030F6442F
MIKTVQAVFLCSFCMSIVAILVSLTILYNTGNMPEINILEIMFIGGLYMPLLPVGRFLLKRLILHKSKGGGGWSYIVEIGLALFIVLLHELLPVVFCLIIFLVSSILVLGFEKRLFPKQEWNMYFERSMR